MTICGAEKSTSQGEVTCTQPEHDCWADHIAIHEDDDTGLWIVSWNGNYTETRQQPSRGRP